MAAGTDKHSGFSDQERQAMKARAKELAAEQRAERKKADGEKEVAAAIAAMTDSDKNMAQRVHDLVAGISPDLWPKTWYGMPAYAKDGKVICFFQAAKKFDSRYATLGFTDTSQLDNGNMWPTSFALINMTKAEEKLVTELVKKALG